MLSSTVQECRESSDSIRSPSLLALVSQKVAAAALERCKVKPHFRKLIPVRCRTLAVTSLCHKQIQKPQAETVLVLHGVPKQADCVVCLSDSNDFFLFLLANVKTLIRISLFCSLRKCFSFSAADSPSTPTYLKTLLYIFLK